MSTAAEKDALREYEVWSTYRVDGVAIVRARSAAEAVRLGLDTTADEPVEFVFSEPYGETRMRARLLFPPGACGICGKPLAGVGTSRCYEAHGASSPGKAT